MARGSFGSSLYNVLTLFTDGFFSISFLNSGIQGSLENWQNFLALWLVFAACNIACMSVCDNISDNPMAFTQSLYPVV